MTRLLLLAVATFSALSAAAQTGRVVGVVTDATTGTPVPGANVFVVGTTLGAATDPDGRYAIEDVPAGPQTLRVTFIGYTRQEVPVPSSPARP